MSNIDMLIDRVHRYYKDHGSWPVVRISKEFWDKYAHEIARLSKEGIEVEVTENLLSINSFILADPPECGGPEIETLQDLKEKVDKMVAEGKGHWPVVHKTNEGSCYTRISIHRIIPGEVPHEGIKLDKSFLGAPKGEHIMIGFADEC